MPRAKKRASAPAAPAAPATPATPATPAPASATPAAPAEPEAAAKKTREMAQRLFLGRFQVSCTCLVADPIAFAPTADRGGVLALVKRNLEGTCHQRLVIDRVVELRQQGLLLCDSESMTGRFRIDVPAVVVEAWSPVVGDLLLGKIHERAGGVTFFRGEAPTPFLAQLVDPTDLGGSGPGPRVVDSCPDGALLPLKAWGVQIPPRHREGATGVVSLWGREPAQNIQVRGRLSAENAGPLVGMAEILQRATGREGDSPVATALKKSFGLQEAPAAGVNLAEVVATVAGGAEVVMDGVWEYAPRAVPIHTRTSGVAAGIPTVDAREFCEFAIRRALGYRLAIARLEEENPSAAKLGKTATVWRAMER